MKGTRDAQRAIYELKTRQQMKRELRLAAKERRIFGTWQFGVELPMKETEEIVCNSSVLECEQEIFFLLVKKGMFWALPYVGLLVILAQISTSERGSR